MGNLLHQGCLTRHGRKVGFSEPQKIDIYFYQWRIHQIFSRAIEVEVRPSHRPCNFLIKVKSGASTKVAKGHICQTRLFPQYLSEYLGIGYFENQ